MILLQAGPTLAQQQQQQRAAGVLVDVVEMREIRDSGRIVGLDRIAVMAALNMANDLIHAKARDQELEGGISDRLKLISDRVDSVLNGTQQLDL